MLHTLRLAPRRLLQLLPEVYHLYARVLLGVEGEGARALALEEAGGAALAQGGTSFDALYVNVNGQSGYFDRSLEVYGREGLPCSRCGTPVVRVSFMNRSSYFCPTCQPRPRRRSA